MTSETTKRDWLAASVSVFTCVVLAGSVVAVPCWYAGMQYFTAKSAYFGYPILTDEMSTYYLIAIGWQLVLPQVLWSIAVAFAATFGAYYVGSMAFIALATFFTPLRRRMEPKVRQHLNLPPNVPINFVTSMLGTTRYFVKEVLTDPSFTKQAILAAAVLPVVILFAGSLSGRDGEKAGQHDAQLLYKMVMGGCSRCYDYRTSEGDIVTGFLVASSPHETLVFSLGELHIFSSGELKGVWPRQPDRAEAAPGEG